MKKNILTFSVLLLVSLISGCSSSNAITRDNFYDVFYEANPGEYPCDYTGMTTSVGRATLSCQDQTTGATLYINIYNTSQDKDAWIESNCSYLNELTDETAKNDYGSTKLLVGSNFTLPENPLVSLEGMQTRIGGQVQTYFEICG